MAQGSPTLVIVGYGHAGRGLVDELIRMGTAGWRRIVVLDERPAGGTTARRSLSADAAGIAVHGGVRATRLDVAERRIVAGGVAISYDALVIATGAWPRPRVELAAGAGIACLDGILVDRHGRTRAPGVYAIGGCAAGDACDLAAVARQLGAPGATDTAAVPEPVDAQGSGPIVFGAAPPSDLLSLLVEAAAPASAWSESFRPALSAPSAAPADSAPPSRRTRNHVLHRLGRSDRPRRPVRSLCS
jgi:NADPH-dependent 2,4-dienoyl-CoA reductase/sulfur reductase-like enzyme